MNNKPVKGNGLQADYKYNSPCLRCKDQKIGCHDEKTCLRWALFQSLKKIEAAKRAEEKKKAAPMRGYYSIKDKRRKWKRSTVGQSLNEITGSRR